MAAREVTAALADDQLAFFETVSAGFARACASIEVVERDYRVAEYTVRLRFAGPALLSAITPALAHLECSGLDAPSFTIDLFDSESTGTPLPFLAARFVDLLRLRWWELLEGRREIKNLNGDRIQSVFHLGPDILSLLDSERDRAVYWVENAAAVPYYEKGYPLSVLLNWWLARQGRYFVHAAAIGLATGGVLLTGKGGSGKSTTTITCIESNLRIVGDDYAAIDPQRAVASSLYNTIKLKGPRDVARFPNLVPCISNLDRVGDGDDAERAMVFLHEHFPHKLLVQMPVRAILVPRIVDRPETRIIPASAALAVKALAPSTVFQLPGNAHAAFRSLVDMVRCLPTYEIELGHDLARIPATIEAFLTSAP